MWSSTCLPARSLSSGMTASRITRPQTMRCRHGSPA
jgi:hypothetical protein